MRRRVYWPGLFTDVKEYVRSCKNCQEVKYSNQKPAGLLGVIEPPKEVSETLYIDFMGPFPASGGGRRNKHLLVVQDDLSKWVEMFPMREAKSKKVAEVLEDQLFCRSGAPKVIVTDNGSQFISKTMKILCKQWRIKHVFTSPYHPQPNQAERSNRNIVPMIAAFVENRHSSWDQHLQKFALALRTAVNETTKVTPSLLFLGREIKLPFDRQVGVENEGPEFNSTKEFMEEVTEWVRDNIKQARVKYKSYYDVKHRDVHYNIGDQVLMRTHDLSSADDGFMKKLGKKWLGPVFISEKTNPVTYKVMDLDGNELGKRHVSDLKPFVERTKYVETRVITNSDRQEPINRPVLNVNNEPVLRRSNRVNYTPGMYRDRLRR